MTPELESRLEPGKRKHRLKPGLQQNADVHNTSTRSGRRDRRVCGGLHPARDVEDVVRQVETGLRVRMREVCDPRTGHRPTRTSLASYGVSARATRADPTGH